MSRPHEENVARFSRLLTCSTALPSRRLATVPSALLSKRSYTGSRPSRPTGFAVARTSRSFNAGLFLCL